MRTLNALQLEIEKLQKERETLIALCEFIPEKLAIFFKETYLDSGYSMGEQIIYTCNGRELLVVDNREHYTGRGKKYVPTHGLIKIDFTKKALKEYCTLLKEMHSLELSKNFEAFFEKGRALKKMVVENINDKESKIKNLTCTAF